MTIIDTAALLSMHNENQNVSHVKNKYKENSTYIQ